MALFSRCHILYYLSEQRVITLSKPAGRSHVTRHRTGTDGRVGPLTSTSSPPHWRARPQCPELSKTANHWRTPVSADGCHSSQIRRTNVRAKLSDAIQKQETRARRRPQPDHGRRWMTQDRTSDDHLASCGPAGRRAAGSNTMLASELECHAQHWQNASTHARTFPPSRVLSRSAPRSHTPIHWQPEHNTLTHCTHPYCQAAISNRVAPAQPQINAASALASPRPTVCHGVPVTLVSFP